MVFINHLHAYVPSLWPGHSAFGESGQVAHAMSYFWTGVDLFYVLSGFFIGLAVLKSAAWEPMHFLKARLTRLLPAYYVSMLVTLVLLERHMLGNAKGWVDIGLHMLMMHSLQSWTLFSINGPYWTLGIEMAFYLTMVALGSLWRSSRGPWLLLFFLIVCYLWRSSLLVAVPFDQRFFLGAQIFGALDEFALGMAVAWLHHKGWLQRIPTAWQGAVSFIALLVGTVLVLAVFRYYLRLDTNYWNDPLATMFSRTVLCAGFALWLLGLLLQAGPSKLNTTLRWSGLPQLGRISFSVYLYHIPVILLMHRTGQTWFDPGWPVVFASFFGTCLVAWCSHRWIEQRWHPSA